jgi:uncharacterized protein YceH (UPF0502 family)
MSSSYSLRSTSYTGEHLDRELTLRGARTSGSTQRKQQRLQRFVEAESNATKFTRLDNRMEELRVTIPILQEVRRSTRISQLLNEYLGY